MERAIRARGFAPGCNRHTLRTYGYLAGTLFVRAHHRAERVQAAMKCRGFQGRFYLMDHFHAGRADALFLFVSGVILVGLVLVQVTNHG